MRQVGEGAAVSGEAAAAFSVMLAGLRSEREQVRDTRPELSFEDVPAPRTLAPFAAALAASTRLDDAEIASGRFVLLYDPAGQRGWAGPLRVIVYIHADLEPEVAADPLVGEVAWSWLTEALEERTTGYEAPSGTVTRVVTEGFGAKRQEPRSSGFELRASWSPAVARDDRAAGAEAATVDTAAARQAAAGLQGHLAAWCAALCAASGLPPPVAGVAAFRAPDHRRGL